MFIEGYKKLFAVLKRLEGIYFLGGGQIRFYFVILAPRALPNEAHWWSKATSILQKIMYPKDSKNPMEELERRVCSNLIFQYFKFCLLNFKYKNGQLCVEK